MLYKRQRLFNKESNTIKLENVLYIQTIYTLLVDYGIGSEIIVNKNIRDSVWDMISQYKLYNKNVSDTDSLPSHLWIHIKKLTVNRMSSLENLPLKLNELIIGNHLNYDFNYSCLTDITRLTFGKLFNQPIGTLPPKITHLELGWTFNQKIDKGVLPKTLKHLIFGNYNQVIEEGVLPHTLTHLTFRNYNQVIDKDVLPKSLIHLTFGCYTKELKRDSLPKSLTHLTFERNFSNVFVESKGCPIQVKYGY